MMKRRIKYKAKGFLKTKESKVTFALGAFIILIMVASVLNLYEKPDTENTYEYKGLTFYNTEAGWIAHLDDGQTITLLSNPKFLENITIDHIPFTILNTMEKIYLSYNPKDRNREAIYQFQQGIKLTPKIVYACYEDNELCYDMPLKTCEDTSETIGVILLKESNETKVNLKYNCLTIQGDNLVNLVDKLILQQV